MAPIDNDILREFVAEAHEHLATIEADLLAIEDAGADIDEDKVNKVFRAAHSIKGASGFFGLEKIKELAHKAETVLDLIRSRKLAPSSEIVNLLLSAFDKLREMVNDPERSESADTGALLASLVELVAVSQPPEGPVLIGSILTATGTELPVVVQPQSPPLEEKRSAYIYELGIDLFADVEQQGRTLVQFLREIHDLGQILDSEVDSDGCGTLEAPGGRRLRAKITFSTKTPIAAATVLGIDAEKVKLIGTPDGDVQAAPAPTAPAAPVAVSADRPTTTVVTASRSTLAATGTFPAVREKDKEPGLAADGTLRVSVGLLESLMNLAGELVLSRNQLRAVLAQSACRGVQASFQRINLVTSELQDAIMQTRMQPVGNVFAKFPRVVRDLSRILKKDILLDIRGKDVGLDKSLIEGLSDPLTHMVRNAVDHGIETVEERVKVGKRASGSLRIEARHEAGQVVLEIADDGQGIDPNRIVTAAVQRGLLTAEAAQAMSDQEKTNLIFLPGLSTAEKVTDVSGRGVGMDVVKTNLERLGGKIEIESEVGQGTLFRIKLPLTLAIIPSLVVSVENERFAIPQISVVELLRIRADKIKERIEIIGDAEVLVLRDELIPVVRFADVLAIPRTFTDPSTGQRLHDRRERLADRRASQANKEEPLPEELSERRRAGDRRQSAASDLEIVVVNTGTMKYGLVVDSFHTGEEIVVKPLGRHLKGLPEYAGATIMGDGTVALIVDAAGLAAKAELTSGSVERDDKLEGATDKLVENRSYLLFYNARQELCATPLEAVIRVERATHAQIETVGGKRTMQYRGTFLPIVTLADIARVGSIESDQDIAIIVARVGSHEIGLLAAMPVDVVDAKATIDRVTHRQTGITGSTIIRDTTVLVADIFEIAQAMFPEWNLERNVEKTEQSSSGINILLAEDSDFFRSQVKRYLESDGYSVIEAEDGEIAWRLLQENAESISAIVSDLEMPNLTGLGLAARVREDSRFGRMPLLALSSLAGEDDIAKGKAAGFDDYQIKLDRDSLLTALRTLLAARGLQAPGVRGTEEIHDGAG